MNGLPQIEREVLRQAREWPRVELEKQLQRRFRTCGQFWGRPSLTHLLGLAVIFRNHDQNLLWNQFPPTTQRCTELNVRIHSVLGFPSPQFSPRSCLVGRRWGA